MQEQSVIDTQLNFYRSGGAGCLFVARAASNPGKFEWQLSVAETNAGQIEELVAKALADESISTQSIIFPKVQDEQQLIELLLLLGSLNSFELDPPGTFNEFTYLGYRVVAGEERSWVTGFGNYNFFPKTRQAIFTEIIFRSKPRPAYDKVLKQAPPGVLHLADMDMKGMGKNKFMSLWYGSFDKTESLLGHKPDILSAARTTFAIPSDLWKSVA